MFEFVLLSWFVAFGHALTYDVGTGKQYPEITAVTGLLKPGDVVNVQFRSTPYNPVVLSVAGTQAQPIRLVGIPSAGGERPIIRGGANSLSVNGAHWNVVSGFEITGATSRCIYHRANNVVMYDLVVHDCASQGLAGADNGSGNLTFSHSEIYKCGSGVYSHQVYMTTDQVTFPGSTFRFEFNYVHSGNGGNNVKSRSERNEIYYNWIESAAYHALDLDAADPSCCDAGFSNTAQNSDIVGNVLVGTSGNHIMHIGGDGTQPATPGGTNGQYAVNFNTILHRGTGEVIRNFFAMQSLEINNNVFLCVNCTTLKVEQNSSVAWQHGRQVRGTNNWLPQTLLSANLPSELTNSVRGTDPGFVNLNAFDVALAPSSPCLNAAQPMSSFPVGYPFPNGLVRPKFEPPRRAKLAFGAQVARCDNVASIGAMNPSNCATVTTTQKGTTTSTASTTASKSTTTTPAAGSSTIIGTTTTSATTTTTSVDESTTSDSDGSNQQTTSSSSAAADVGGMSNSTAAAETVSTIASVASPFATLDVLLRWIAFICVGASLR